MGCAGAYLRCEDTVMNCHDQVTPISKACDDARMMLMHGYRRGLC